MPLLGLDPLWNLCRMPHSVPRGDLFAQASHSSNISQPPVHLGSVQPLVLWSFLTPPCETAVGTHNSGLSRHSRVPRAALQDSFSVEAAICRSAICPATPGCRCFPLALISGLGFSMCFCMILPQAYLALLGARAHGQRLRGSSQLFPFL